MRSEYQLDYAKARPNRFAARVGKGQTVVLLDSDVSKYFRSSEAVNTALRTLVTLVPKPSRKTK